MGACMVRTSKADRIFDAIVYLIMAIVCIVIIIPLLYVLANSLSDPEYVYFGEVGLIPIGFTFSTYREVLTYNDYQIIIGFLNSVKYTVLGTIISVVLTFFAAYPLSRKDLKGRNFFMTLFIITMFFNGGLIPTFIIVRGLGLYNTTLGFIMPGALSVYNMIIVRTYMMTGVPWEIQEAAMMDGASSFLLFFRIVLPLCTPVFAIMLLFYGVGYWNSYYNALIYLQDVSKVPIQMVLKSLFDQSQSSGVGGTDIVEQAKLTAAMQFTVIVVAMLPVMVVYPFLQKYFEKGMMIGSLKG